MVNKYHKRAATCLYVEDEESIRRSMTNLLSHLFDNVISASEGAEAFELFKANKVDVVITDLSMPSDGVSLIDRIREIDVSVPIIIHTAHSSFEEVYEEVPYVYFLIKPIDLEALLKLMDTHVDLDMVVHSSHIEAAEKLEEVQKEARVILDKIWHNRNTR